MSDFYNSCVISGIREARNQSWTPWASCISKKQDEVQQRQQQAAKED